MCDICDMSRTEIELFRAERAAEKVQCGIKILNLMVEEGRLSPDWVDSLDMDKFDITSTRTCILGQLFPGGYWEAVDILSYGEDYLLDGGFTTEDNDWTLLQEAWSQAIRALRNV